MNKLKHAEYPVVTTSSEEKLENIAERKNIVLKTIIDPTIAKIQGEKIKRKMFFGLFPNIEKFEFASIDKYYETYILISGRYQIDYFRKKTYKIDVDKSVKEVIILKHSLFPKEYRSDYSIAFPVIPDYKVEVPGEERLIKDEKAILILNEEGQPAKLDDIPSVACEKQPNRFIQKYGLNQISPSFELQILREKIANRPNDVCRVLNESFEVNERSIIYVPRYRLSYNNVKNKRKSTIILDGITMRRIHSNQNGLLILPAKIKKGLYRLVSKAV